MIARRVIRVGVTFNRTHYFVDQGQERGIAYEALKQFETDLNTELKTGNLKVHVVMVPMSREQLYPALTSGKIDMVAAMVTVTPEREKLVAFSTPTRTDVNQVVVTGPGAPPIATGGGSLGQGSLRPQGQHLRRERHRPQQAAEGGRQAAGHDQRRAGCARRRRHARDGQCRPRADHHRRRLPRRILEQGVHQPQGAQRRHAALPAACSRWRFARRIPKLRDDGQRVGSKARQGRRLPQRARTPLPGECQLRQERRGGGRAQEARGGGRAVQEVRRAVRRRLPADGGAGLPGIDPRSERQEPGRRDRRDAGHAAHR